MIKENKGKLIISSILILVPIIFGVIFWNKLPQQMATHWNIKGEADSWSSRTFAVFGLPLVLLLFHWICILGTAKDKSNKDKNQRLLALVLWIIPLLSIFVNGITYLTALGYTINIATCFTLLFAFLFLVIGNYLPKCQQNYILGIKIPWTLKNEENWNATHRFAGKLWFVCGLLLLVAAIIQILSPFSMAFALNLALIVVVVLVPMLYSYLYYKKQGEK